MSNLTPKDLDREPLKQYAMIQISHEMLNLPKSDKKYVKRDWSPEKMAEFQRFREQWEESERYGWDNGFLTNEHCYECGGETKVGEEMYDWVEEEEEK